MSFANWRKCDFQVHSPRDPNWKGSRPVGIDTAPVERVDADRAQWADRFVEQCTRRELKAIALTDHHEMIMVPYVQQAIETRAQSDSEFDLWFFPGMELTAKGGRQCIILFDADLPEEQRKLAQAKLGIHSSEVDEKRSQASRVTQLACSYPDIAGSLDEVESLRGRYIILPNVSQGNKHTVLTEGAHADFRRMPYVGGYLDPGQTIHTLTKKNCKRLSGNVEVWSQRTIYPLPTSDSRSADFSALGSNNSWIKIAEPTAEAIRQAFLGHRSRIRIRRPELPSFVITKMEVDGSTILENTDLALSPEFNAVIGGRGSGKSTLLEYLAFALGRSSKDIPRDHYSGTDRMCDLVEDSFIKKNGRILLEARMDRAPFRIVRSSETEYHPQITFHKDKATKTVEVDELRRLFPAAVYSQGELAEIRGRNTRESYLSDLLQLVSPTHKQMDDELRTRIDTAKSAVGSEVQKVVDSWELEARLRSLTNKRDSLRQRADALEQSLPQRSEGDQATLARYERMSEFDRKLVQASKHADQISERLESVTLELRTERDLSADLEGAAQAVQRHYSDLHAAFESGMTGLMGRLAEKREVLKAAESEWQNSYQESLNARNDVLARIGNQKAVTNSIIDLRKEIKAITGQIDDYENQRGNEGDPTTHLQAALTELRRINEERDHRTLEWAKTIELLSGGKISASVTVGANAEEIRDAVDIIAAKTGSHEATRRSALDRALRNATPTEFVDQLRKDCLMLLRWHRMGAAQGEKQPECALLFNLVGGTERIREMVIDLMDVARVEAIAAAVAKPGIALKYNDDSRSIPFEKASDGQRAAALLFMLLEQEGGPLIIDQPEGDLDNKIITELTERLHEAKQKRQLVFASHNANLVVNGAAEMVAHLDVGAEGERLLAQSGAIDSPEVCNVITATMEGGERAFRDRQDKYGY